ncbi:MAG: WD40 repeat domain-containing protein [Bradymonadia bacterium]
MLAFLCGCAAEGPEEQFNRESKAITGDYVMPIRAMRYSVDGRQLLASDDEGRVYSFDLTSGQESVIHTGHNTSVIDMQLGRDGRLVSFGLDGAIRVLNVRQTEVQSRARLPEEPASLLLVNPSGGEGLLLAGRTPRKKGPTFCSPQGEPLYLVDHRGEVMKYGFRSGAARCVAWGHDGQHYAYVEGRFLISANWFGRRTVFRALLPNAEDVQGVAVTNDGLRAAAITRGELRLYELNNPDPVHVLGRKVISNRSLPVLFTPDDQSIIALLPDIVEPGRYNLDRYNAQTGQLEARLFANVPESLIAVAVSPDGNQVALAERGGRIHRARTSDGEPIGNLEAKTWLGGGAAISQDGRRIATCWQSEVQIRATDSGRVEGQFTVSDLECLRDFPIALGPAGEVVLLGTDAKTQPFQAFDRQGRGRATYDRPANTTVHHPVFSQNGQWVSALVLSGDLGRVYIWPVRGGAPTAEMVLPPIGSIRDLVVTNDGRQAFISMGRTHSDGTLVGEVIGLNGNTGLNWTAQGPDFWLTGKLALTPDERFILFTSEADEGLILDTRSGEVIARLVNSADTVWTFARFGTVGAFSVLPEFEDQTPRQPRHYLNAIAVNPQGDRVAIAGYNQSNRQAMLEVFDLTDGDLLAVYPLRTYPRALHFDGQRILTPGVAVPEGDFTLFNLTDRRMAP